MPSIQKSAPCAVATLLSRCACAVSGPLQLDKCFGYETCVEEAQKALLAAKVEASSAYRGVGLVKLMGRWAGPGWPGHEACCAVCSCSCCPGLVLGSGRPLTSHHFSHPSTPAGIQGL